MNINLSSAKKPEGKGKKSLGFGLNKRKKTNVFDDDSDKEEDDTTTSAQDNEKSRRDAVNQEIAAEQAALRKRAMKAMSSNAYDYDGSYDQLERQAKQKEEAEAAAKAPQEKKSRYIQDLLKQSEKRAIEREAVYERKVAREQAEEDAQADYRGKEKFVTKAYKRKLEERQRMAAEDEKQRKIDEKEDVTKRTGGAAMANFYGNLNKNVAMGGADDNDKQDKNKDKDKDKGKEKDASRSKETVSGLGFTDGFERTGGGDTGGAGGTKTREEGAANLTSKTEKPSGKTKSPPEEELDPVARNQAMRKARKEKLAKARIRYFERNGMPLPRQS